MFKKTWEFNVTNLFIIFVQKKKLFEEFFYIYQF